MVEVLNKGCESCFEYVRTGFEPFHCDTVPPYELEATFAPSATVNRKVRTVARGLSTGCHSHHSTKSRDTGDARL
jgi:hypothetical protein